VGKCKDKNGKSNSRVYGLEIDYSIVISTIFFVDFNISITSKILKIS